MLNQKLNAKKNKQNIKTIKILEGNMGIILYKLGGTELAKYELKFRCLRRKVHKFDYI